jgi:hypothetical protein
VVLSPLRVFWVNPIVFVRGLRLDVLRLEVLKSGVTVVTVTTFWAIGVSTTVVVVVTGEFWFNCIPDIKEPIP